MCIRDRPAGRLRKPASGRPRAAVRPYYEGLPFGGLDAARTKVGESLPDRVEPKAARARVRKLRPRGQKSRDGAPRGARVPRTRGAARRKTGAPLLSLIHIS